MKAVILAAGYGTRFLPVTKVVPKELLPLVDRPAIDFVLDELEAAGISEVLVISSRRKKALEDWFDHDVELETVFTREGATAKLDKVRPRALAVHFTRQAEMKGTGHALYQARHFVGDEPFVMAYPDDLFPDLDATRRLVEVHEQTGGCVLAATELPDQDVSRYGVIDFAEGDGDHLAVRRVVEKPAPGSEPSKVISLGRYLYTPEIFPLLEAGLRDHDAGEFYPMDALETLASRGRVHAALVEGRRWDTGQPFGYLQAVIEEALGRDTLGPQLRSWLLERLED